ncbi:ABC transporter substrate-binding protein [Streptomyces sp. TRM68367]|uniref:ABC transporter substrate-binding protein n=1 Tax=Streptomyces sp. TRM68367 TaxID=2758415 RepID=UPI00165BFA63|nr:hypothetical protein [Streptomyces sp. TRM68367]MBC9730420.1 hypothetical protein [Streptomyces sp. TRM68367]
MSRTDRRNWVWLPSRLRFRVFGLIDVVVLWVLVAALLGTGTWWGLDTYWKHRDYCTQDLQLRRTGPECIGVTAAAYPFAQDLNDVLGRIEAENEAARSSGKPVVSVAVVMPYTSTPGAAMSQELIRHSLQGAYVAQRAHNRGPATGGTAIQLLFANVGEDLSHWQTVTRELAARRGGEAPVVAAIGFPNSDDDTLDSVQQGLGRAQVRIPAVSAVLSSREMEHPYLFKVSPSTDQLVDALKRYVTAYEVNRRDTYLIADEQADNYVENLRRVFLDEFGEEYGIRADDAVERRIAVYRGSKGANLGDPRDFRQAVDAMCALGVKTVFLAGRDADLPPFLETLDRRSPCNWGTDEEPLRILRVSTGRDPDTETARMRKIADRNHIEIVTAAAVDAPRWRAGSGGDDQVPRFFGDFAASYGQYFRGEKTDALNDGYAVMYHDALTAVGTAVAAAQDGKDNPVDHDDVYDALRRGSPSERCVGCVPGASGVFTFVDENIGLDEGAGNEAAVGRWPVCKPVPVVAFPKERSSALPLYRTYQKSEQNTCPRP